MTDADMSETEREQARAVAEERTKFSDLRQQAQFGAYRGGSASAEARKFTRSEVLTVLKAEQARHTPVFSAGDQHAADQGRARTLNDLIAIFERME